MNYADKYQDIAERLWSRTNKGPLLNPDGASFVNYTGLSSGEGVIQKVCMAIAAPQAHRMPPLDDISHRLSEVWQLGILDALNEMFLYRN